MGTFKTESLKGEKEYSPKKTMSMTTETTIDKNWEVDYRNNLLDRLSKLKASKARRYWKGLYEPYIVFNQDLNNPMWTFDLEKLRSADLDFLRSLVVILENEKV